MTERKGDIVKEKQQGQSVLRGAVVLMITTVIVQLIGIFYKIPITAIIGTVGRGYFTSAYELYTPIYAISMAGLPVAVSKMVSERMATGLYREVREVRAVARRLYLLTGLFGTGLMLLLAYPYTHWDFFINTPNAMWSVIGIAPSILFCCMMSSYRGYYEGLRNMRPTGYSQVIEAVGKLIFGVVLAFLVKSHGLNAFFAHQPVYGVLCKTYEEALGISTIYSTAAAIFGVTIGTILGLIFLMILHRVRGDGITAEMLASSPDPISRRDLAGKLIKFAIPVLTSSLVLNITNLIDTWTIQNRLNAAIAKAPDIIEQMYLTEIMASHIQTADLKDFLYGAYGTAMDFRNLIPTMVMTLGLSSLPVLSGAWATRDKEKIDDTIHTVLKTAMLIAMPAGFCMAVLAHPILEFFYIGTNAAPSITISDDYIIIYGIFAFLLSISTPITNMLQAVNRQDMPVKSMLVGAGVKIGLNYLLVGNLSINIQGAPIGTIVFSAIVIGMNLGTLIKETKVKIHFVDTFLKPTLTGVIAAVVCQGVYVVFMRILPSPADPGRFGPNFFAMIAAAILAIVVWVLSLFLLKVVDKEFILRLPKGGNLLKVLEKVGLMR